MINRFAPTNLHRPKFFVFSHALDAAISASGWRVEMALKRARAA